MEDAGTPTTLGAVIIIAAVLLPGFVTVLMQERTFRSADDATALDRLLRIVWYSAWSYVVWAIVAVVLQINRHDVVSFYHRHTADPAQLVWRGALIVLFPSVLIAESTRRWHGSDLREKVLTSRFFGRSGVNVRHRVPTAWDYFFRQGHDSMVRLTLSNGKRVLGYYGPRSFAAYSKDGADLFLERLYAETEQQWFGRHITESEGVWVRGSDIVLTEFYPPVDGGAKAEDIAEQAGTQQLGTTASQQLGSPGSSSIDEESGSSSAAPEAERQLNHAPRRWKRRHRR